MRLVLSAAELPEPELGDVEAAQLDEPAPPTATPMSSAAWYGEPYQLASKRAAGAPSSLPRALYWPGNPSGKAASVDGPDVVAYKRIACRLGRWEPWDTSRWDDSYSKAFATGRGTGNVGDSGIAGVQRQQSIDDTGFIGAATYDVLTKGLVPAGRSNAGQLACDSVAAGLLADAAAMFQKGAQLADVEAAIADYCRRCIANEPGWHYSQARPMTHLGRSPEAGGTCDCSGHSTGAYFWGRKVTGVAVPDPNHRGYDGYGYTGSLIDNPKTGAPYKIGDLAIYGTSPSNTTHVVTCYIEGSSSTARWCSHGSEAGPYAVALGYRSDLLAVVRPGLLP